MTTSQALRPGRKLKVARVLADMDQSELAERAGVHQTFISLLERGKRGANPETWEALAGALGIPVTELLPDKQAA